MVASKVCSACGAELRLRPHRCPLCGADVAEPKNEPAEPTVESYQEGLRELREQLKQLRDDAEEV